MKMQPEKFYLELTKKTPSFVSWRGPPAPIEAYAYAQFPIKRPPLRSLVIGS